MLANLFYFKSSVNFWRITVIMSVKPAVC